MSSTAAEPNPSAPMGAPVRSVPRGVLWAVGSSVVLGMPAPLHGADKVLATAWPWPRYGTSAA